MLLLLRYNNLVTLEDVCAFGNDVRRLPQRIDIHSFINALSVDA